MYTIVIADDEKIECISLKLLLANEFSKIQVAAVVSNGIELVQAVSCYHPDIALVDVNMPGMSGLEAIEILRAKEHLKTRFIILTAYDEFEYVRKALALKVNDYILKPLKKEVIVKTLTQALRDIDESRNNLMQKRKREDIFVKMDHVLEKEIVYSILMGEPDMDDFAVFCEMKQCVFRRGIFLMAVSDRKLDKREETLKEQLQEWMRNVLSNMAIYLFSMNGGSFYFVIFVPEHIQSGEIQVWAEDLVSVLLNELQQRCGLVCRAGISSVQERFQDMFLAYQEAKTSLEVLAGQDIVFYPQIGSVTENLDAVHTSGKPVLSEENITNSYILEAVRFMKENYHQDISLENIADRIGISTSYLSRMFRQEMGIKLTEYLTELRIEKAIILARTTDCTISELGRQVGYCNPTYFCRIFKKVTGKTIGQVRQREDLAKSDVEDSAET